MVEDLFGNFIKYLRLINKKYFITNVVFLKRLLHEENISIQGYLKDFVVNNPEIVKKCFKIIYKT